jgi:hypothetical protein
VKTLWPTPLWMAWLVLTLLSLASARVGGADTFNQFAIVALFAIAGLKAVLVLEVFMEASLAERHWHWLYRAWIAVVTMILMAGFVLSAS